MKPNVSAVYILCQKLYFISMIVLTFISIGVQMSNKRHTFLKWQDIICKMEFFHDLLNQKIKNQSLGLKFRYSEKANKIWPIFFFWHYLVASNYKWKIGQIFVAFILFIMY